MPPLDPRQLETDPRFPSGPWTGFFMQRVLPGRSTMTLDLTFHDGQLEAKGSDIVGPFTFTGTYDREDGKCRWTKKYLRKHRVAYTGVNEGQGIWGVWEINLLWGLLRDRGVFHIWPANMPAPDETDLTERAFGDGAAQPSFLKVFVGIAFLATLYFLFRYFGVPWLDKLLP
jgi:hypothetical protein